MHFAFDDKTTELLGRVQEFMDEHVYPAEPALAAQLEDRVRRDDWSIPEAIQEVRAKGKAAGLWNFFQPAGHGAGGGAGEYAGAGLTNLQYAPIAELTGRSIQLAPQAFNCAAPDTGNMEVLTMFGTPEQKAKYLRPLLDGEIKSAFAMTEPDVASSDATNVEMSIVRDGGDYVINGRKFYITGAMNPNCTVFIVMGKTDPSAERHRQQSMILVDRDTPGLEVVRGMHVFGYHDRDHGGHAEVVFNDVRVPVSNIIGEEGQGFAIAQARLGPGRIHHCMRSIGIAERAIEMMAQRAQQRVAFGKPLANQGVVRDWIAESRVKVEQLRLLVLKTAWLMDTVGNKGAHTEIQAIKIATPETVNWILDKAIQVHGAAGISQDFPLAEMWAGIRTLRFADGPDEVHKNSLAKAELAKHTS